MRWAAVCISGLIKLQIKVSWFKDKSSLKETELTGKLGRSPILALEVKRTNKQANCKQGVKTQNIFKKH